MKKRSFILYFAMCAVTLSGVASAERLDLSEGTMTLGGQITFNISTNDISMIQSENLKAGVSLDGGFFLYDNFEVNALLGTSLVFASPVLAEVKLGAGARYYFDIESIFFPYLGTQPRFKWNGEGSSSIWSFELPLMAGVVMGLNSHVAIDVGVLSSFSWVLGSGSGKTALNFSIGYVGIRSFF